METTPYPAPNFILVDQTGLGHSLIDYRGSWLVLYFYPKDDTPGCTIEACSLRDARDDLAALGASVVGISRDDVSSHHKFAAKHKLDFTLLSDDDATVIKAYGAWGKSGWGREGILRRTFIINPEGQVVKVYGRVTPIGHGPKIVADLAALQASA